MAFKKTFIVSTEDVNTHGFRVKTAGIRLDNAKQNCPCFYDHNTWEVPLGHWENFRIDNNKLLADLVINGDNDREKQYINKITNGDIKGASIGADPLKWNEAPEQLTQGQTRPTCEECDLFEISLTPLPANTAALALKHKGSLIKLSAENDNIIPSLQKKAGNMDEIKRLLGLSADATEDQVRVALKKQIRLAKNAEAMQKLIADKLTVGLTQAQKDLFIKLSKTDISSAMDYLDQVAPSEILPEDEGTEQGAEGAEGATTATAKKPAKVAVNRVSDLIAANLHKGTGGKANAASDGKDTYDYLWKHNSVELRRIQSEDPEKFAQLKADYAKGVRYTGK